MIGELSREMLIPDRGLHDFIGSGLIILFDRGLNDRIKSTLETHDFNHGFLENCFRVGHRKNVNQEGCFLYWVHLR